MTRLNVLILCEQSGTIRNAFARAGHYAMSVDIAETTAPIGPMGLGEAVHHVGDALDFAVRGAEHHWTWDLVIAHPMCTYLTNSGVRWLFEGTKIDPESGERTGRLTDRAVERWAKLREAIGFHRAMATVNSPCIAIENPRPHRHAVSGWPALDAFGAEIEAQPHGIGPSDQEVQPWMFGEAWTKGTNWWLTGLPKLEPTENVLHLKAETPKGEWNRVHYASPGEGRWLTRSEFAAGMADAIVDQWGAAALKMKALK